jgi:hypothetical protein
MARHTTVDARGYGGRRIGFKISKEAQQAREDMERHLLELARRAILKNRTADGQGRPVGNSTAALKEK